MRARLESAPENLPGQATKMFPVPNPYNNSVISVRQHQSTELLMLYAYDGFRCAQLNADVHRASMDFIVFHGILMGGRLYFEISRRNM